MPIPVYVATRNVGKDDTTHFTRFGQCQVDVPTRRDEARGVFHIVDEAAMAATLEWCLDTARDRGVEVLVMPEYSLAVSEPTRARFLDQMNEYAVANKAIVVGGSYYDEDRRNRLTVVGPGWLEYGYKFRASRYEASPRAGMGMVEGKHILVMDTDLGSFAIITCVDLISDDVQYTVRRMINDGKLDALININKNPASWEFLIEVNSLVRRHPIAASITNATFGMCEGKPDNGKCGGHTALATDLRTGEWDWPNNASDLVDLLPPPILERTASGPKRRLAYSNLVADVGYRDQGMLVYDLNMRMNRITESTVAPDMGYPPVRNLEIVRRQ